jgi:branched-chain amino acid transport system permease protein
MVLRLRRHWAMLRPFLAQGQAAAFQHYATLRRHLDALPSSLRRLPAHNAVPVAIFVIFAVIPFAAGFSTYLLNLFARIMIFAIAAVALDLIVGYGGLVSFGHAAFVGLGAYAVGILATSGITEILIALPIAILVAALFALATGYICLRTKGVHFIMITLAFGQMAFFTASSLAPYGGDDGLTIRTRDSLLGLPVFHDDTARYYLSFLALLGAFLLCRSIVGSRFGRVLRGARENPTRMAAIGFAVFRYQLIAYVIAGALGGVSGFLLANATAFVSPAYMAWQRSGELIIMVVLGGIGTLYGAIIGAAAFVLAEEWLPGLTEQWKMIFGPLLVLVVLFARGGLIGLSSRLAADLGDRPLERGREIAIRHYVDLERVTRLWLRLLRRRARAAWRWLEPILRTGSSRAATDLATRLTRVKNIALRLYADLLRLTKPRLLVLRRRADALRTDLEPILREGLERATKSMQRLRDGIVRSSVALSRRWRDG